MLVILLILIEEIACSKNNFVLTPANHEYCRNRIKTMVMNELTLDHRRLSLIIEPNITSVLIGNHPLCPITVIRTLKKPNEKTLQKEKKIGFWFLAMKVHGDLSCTDLVGYGELHNSNDDLELQRTEINGKKLDCHSKLPVIFYGSKYQIAVWWAWSKGIMPRVQIDIISYIRFTGSFEIQEKEKICNENNGFWCGNLCIDIRLRCDGRDDCKIFSNSNFDSTDEVNCTQYNRSFGYIKTDSSDQSFWIRNIFFILLSIIGLILIISAIKIYVTNFVVSKHLRTKKKFSTRNSPLYSLSLGDSDIESAYDDIEKCSETESKKNSSLIISGDEETQEEILGTSKEYLDSVYNNNVFHPQLVSPRKQCDEKKNHTVPVPVELHSLSSYQFQDCPTDITKCTSISLTGTMLCQGHNAISEISSPGSSRTFRKIFKNNLNKTSSYDKILMSNDASSRTSRDVESIKTTPSIIKPKSHTISRLENNDVDNDNFTAYVII